MAGNNVLGAVSIIMLGTIMAGYQSLSANFFGYAFVMGNNILTAVLYTEVREVPGTRVLVYDLWFVLVRRLQWGKAGLKCCYFGAEMRDSAYPGVGNCLGCRCSSARLGVRLLCSPNPSACLHNRTSTPSPCPPNHRPLCFPGPVGCALSALQQKKLCDETVSPGTGGGGGLPSASLLAQLLLCFVRTRGACWCLHGRT
jgi:hypothetical protein